MTKEKPRIVYAGEASRKHNFKSREVTSFSNGGDEFNVNQRAASSLESPLSSLTPHGTHTRRDFATLFSPRYNKLGGK